MEFRKLRPDEIEVRPGQKIGKKKDGISLLLYKDARADMIILDEAVGPENWQRQHEVIGGNLYCNVGIYVDRRGEGYGDWVWKQDVGTESNTEKEKGQASDAFKRACTNWGIGRELYTGPRMQLWAGQFNSNFDTFTCVDVKYDGRRIQSVTIKVGSTNEKHTFTHDTSVIEPTEVEAISEKEAEVVRALIKSSVFTEERVLENYSIARLEDMTTEEYVDCVKILENHQKGEGNG